MPNAASMLWTPRYNHTNKTLFNLVHAKHHDQKAALDTRSGGYATFLDTLGGASLPLMCIYALGVATGNWWFAFAGQ
jgi:sterol desaturase/sphingolipid hydroxylase (fatty acid hydroxylase superfamily)